MTLLLHGKRLRRKYLVDVGELVPVSAVNARSAYLMVRPVATPLHAMAPQPPKVYQLDSKGELIAVFD
jgi:hypothetical protein